MTNPCDWVYETTTKLVRRPKWMVTIILAITLVPPIVHGIFKTPQIQIFPFLFAMWAIGYNRHTTRRIRAEELAKNGPGDHGVFASKCAGCFQVFEHGLGESDKVGSVLMLDYEGFKWHCSGCIALHREAKTLQEAVRDG